MKNPSVKTEDSHFFKWGGDGQPYGLCGEYYATYRTDLLLYLVNYHFGL